MLKTFLSTFGLVFVAELGDKTQLATMLLVARTGAPVAVFLGSASALVVSALVGVLAGGLITRVVPPNYIQFGAGAAFVILGVLLMLGKF